MALAIRESLGVLPRRAVRSALRVVRVAKPQARKGPGFFVWWRTMMEDYANLVMPKFEE